MRRKPESDICNESGPARVSRAADRLTHPLHNGCVPKQTASAITGPRQLERGGLSWK
jgi:hypothetical protein